MCRTPISGDIVGSELVKVQFDTAMFMAFLNFMLSIMVIFAMAIVSLHSLEL